MKARCDLMAAMLAGRPLLLQVIDIHGHASPLSDFHIPGCDPASMIKVMDRLGVATVCISAHTAWYADARLGNDYIAEATMRFPGRFLGYAAVNPHYPLSVKSELKRCFDKLGFRLIKLHPGVHQYRLDGEGYTAAYRFAADRGAIVLTHTWDNDATCSPDVAAQVARRWPQVTFIWGHAGAPTFDKALEYAKELPNVYVDLACSQVFDGTVEHFLERAPVEKVLYASDFVFLSLPQQIAKVVFSNIGGQSKRMILRDNALRLLQKAGVELSRA